MKKTGCLLSGVFTLFLFAACGGSNPSFEQEDALLKEVFAIHDEVMPRMSEIVALKVGLEKEMTLDSTRAAALKTTLTQLEMAEDGMMDWMNKFTQPEKLRETKSHEEIMLYLENEKLQISKVRDDMNNSIETAESILKNQAQ